MFSITQTSDGFLWFLSLSGDVYRFDGVRFVPWRFPAGVLNSPVGKVFADHAGGLWVVAEELVHVKDGVVTSQFALEGLHGFQSISQDPDGSLWIGLRGSDAPLCRVREGAVKCFGKAEGIPIAAINAVLSDGNGGYWLGGPTALVHWQRSGVSETYPVKAMITSLARAADGTLWVGMLEEGAGLGQLKEGAVRPFATPTLDGSKLSVTTMLLDRDGSLWVGSDEKGVFRIHGNAVEHYTHTEGLSGDSAWALFEDREGMVWAGTTSGIDRFRDPSIVTFSAVEGLGKDLAAGILSSRDGTIWVANNGSLDRIKNGIVSSIGRSNGLPGTQVASMLEDHKGNLWVGVDDGLYLFKDGRFRRLPEPDRQPLGMVVGIAEDIDGNIWAECRSKPSKLVRIRDFQVREVFSASQVPPGHHLAPDPNGGIWIVTSTGDLVLLRNGIQETKISLDPKSSALNRHVIAQADGSVLVGTEKGLVKWRAGKVQRLTTKNGLPCDFVIAFIEDQQKRWWLYTRCGVVEFSDAEFQRWWANPDTNVQNRVYDTFDGAQPNIGSFNAAATTPDGRVWFSSGVVVQMVDPSKLAPKALPAQTHIESVVADRKDFKATPNLKIPPNPRDLRIDYTSPTFLIPQKMNFRYRLDNYDRNWHEAGTRRQAFYTDLPPGKYTFRVIAANSDGVWNEAAAKLDFFVAPAYYQTIWFRALIATFVLGMVWTLYQWRVRQLHHQFEMTLEARVGERMRIARELHDTLLQSFHGLLLRFQTVSQLLPERPAEAKERLESAIEQAAEAITEGRDAVQGLRASTVQGNDLAEAISTLGEEFATDSTDRPKAALQVAVEGRARDLHPIVRDEIYRIAAEALRNAFRHAEPRRVEVEIRYANDEFRMRVRDDGKGVDPAVLAGQVAEGHYGLRGMRERATLIGGKLDVWSHTGAGTEVELRVPADVAYAKGSKRSWWEQKLVGEPKTGNRS
jgi:signal transduction histidine kinase/ligand-binding sensor domain-containing protein